MLTTDDRVRLDAHHDPGPSELGIVLAHGFTGSWRRPGVRRAAEVLGEVAGVVSFDFRGHGRSGGVSTVGDREVFDLAAAVEWARSLGYRQVATVGFSMGAAVAIRHAADRGAELAGVVAISGPARWFYRDTAAMRRVHWVIETRLGRLAGRVLRQTRIAAGGWQPVPEPPDTAIARIAPTPLLVVHGDADPLFPVEHAHTLHQAAREPKELWVVPGFGHAENAARPALLRRVADWLTNQRPAAATPPGYFGS
ncbi:alpha/beta fold hydrolase [Natronosporangium hydrolyticum]|uniref:Alpha/beta fold hydrolase n=1 Tax=Natronosporangium hydrolyticum TaxID=2811111 RepID=A0A895YPA9_9ACTN|nr:alpha/beta fold hydrolase [Natronosporangium hydrolyticum]QSB17319.1 alpha/beta fold hydrolase [Natronosporangium hydrolyticum]